MKKSKDISMAQSIWCVFYALLNAWLWSEGYEASVVFIIVFLLGLISFRQMKQMGI